MARSKGTRSAGSMRGGRSKVARSRSTSAMSLSSTTGGVGQFSARSGKRKGHGLPHGFVSKAQWRYFFANPQLRAKYAHKEAHKTPGGPKVRYRRLVDRKGGATTTTARKGPSRKG